VVDDGAAALAGAGAGAGAALVPGPEPLISRSRCGRGTYRSDPLLAGGGGAASRAGVRLAPARW